LAVILRSSRSIILRRSLSLRPGLELQRRLPRKADLQLLAWLRGWALRRQLHEMHSHPASSSIIINILGSMAFQDDVASGRITISGSSDVRLWLAWRMLTASEALVKDQSRAPLEDYHQPWYHGRCHEPQDDGDVFSEFRLPVSRDTQKLSACSGCG
jgi:hypothetical protein